MASERIITHEITIPATGAGKRLDQVLAELFPDYSRTRIKEWITTEQVLVDGSPVRPRERVVGGEEVRIRAAIAEEVEAGPEPIALNLVYEDADLIVVDKPAGLVVHPGAGNPEGTLQNALLYHAPELRALPRAGIVHRLDKQTSGLLVVARSVRAHTDLIRQLEARVVRRDYLAICVGVLTAGGTIDMPIGRHAVDRIRMAVTPKGRPAITHYRVVERFRGHTLIRVSLETGRTHQIRVHLAHLGHPLVGDPMYGGRLTVPRGMVPDTVRALRGFKRQALHAYRLGLIHPGTGEPCDWESPLPRDLETLVQRLREDTP